MYGPSQVYDLIAVPNSLVKRSNGKWLERSDSIVTLVLAAPRVLLPSRCASP